MNPTFLVIPLPRATQSRLTSLCYGLPQVRWIEEGQFNLILHQFGPLADHQLELIHEQLEHLFFHPFSLILQGVNTSHSKEKRGTIWMGVRESPEISLLKKEIAKKLSGLPFSHQERMDQLRVTLGYYDRIHPERFGDYLNMHGDYQSLPVDVTRLVLVRAIQTPKRIVYETVEEYLGSPIQRGED